MLVRLLIGARTQPTQKTEVKVAAGFINITASLGMPVSRRSA
jgi:hypothetical protein